MSRPWRRSRRCCGWSGYFPVWLRPTAGHAHLCHPADWKPWSGWLCAVEDVAVVQHIPDWASVVAETLGIDGSRCLWPVGVVVGPSSSLDEQYVLWWVSCHLAPCRRVWRSVLRRSC